MNKVHIVACLVITLFLAMNALAQESDLPPLVGWSTEHFPGIPFPQGIDVKRVPGPKVDLEIKKQQDPAHIFAWILKNGLSATQ